MNILVTGGAGFIGSNFLNRFVKKHPEHFFVNIDKLTYAANLLNLKSIENASNYKFEHVDINNFDLIADTFLKYSPDLVVHFAAESHVDRSIIGPSEFIHTNIVGTFNLLEACRHNWQDNHDKRFIHVSTDEVYGSLLEEGFFTETTAYNPSSPYSASKAASDHLVRAYYRTYDIPTIITNCSNNYGPYQFPEKLIPVMILNALENKPLPVYGNGKNVRDWIYVEDHCEALWEVIHNGQPGETYNIGGGNELQNIALVREICTCLAEETNCNPNCYLKLIKFVEDRPGHDLRYAIDTSKITRELGWQPKESFPNGLKKTIHWYISNSKWVQNVKTGAYREWITKNYQYRLSN